MRNKRAYSKPILESETFVPQNYIAACGDTEYGNYLFECNAGLENTSYNVFFNDGTPYASSNGDDEWYAPFTGYHPCYEKHEAATNSEFLNGYMYKQDRRGNNSGSRINVIIWTDNRTNVHCTKNLNQDSWEMAKS